MRNDIARSRNLAHNLLRKAGRLLMTIFYAVVAGVVVFAVGFVIGRVILIAIGSTPLTRAVLGWSLFLCTASAGILAGRAYLKSSALTLPRPEASKNPASGSEKRPEEEPQTFR